MSVFVVDASVGVKWFVPEVHAAARLAENARSPSLDRIAAGDGHLGAEDVSLRNGFALTLLLWHTQSGEDRGVAPPPASHTTAVDAEGLRWPQAIARVPAAHESTTAS